MAANISSIGLKGMQGYKVTVEVEKLHGIESVVIVGLPDTAIKESRERVISALKSTGCSISDRKIIINLAPAEHKKNGPVFDLPIAIGILKCLDVIKGEIPAATAFLGALSLDGRVQRVDGILPSLLAAKQLGFKKLYLPLDAQLPLHLVDGVEIVAVHTISDVLSHLAGQLSLSCSFPEDVGELPITKSTMLKDFSYILGHEKAKRAFEIAAAGEHNLLMSGPPGCGKSMLAESFSTILPPLSREAQIEVMSLYQMAGVELPDAAMPPYRQPHHTSSYVSMIGGGTNPKPGEISLAHHGVLFLDEIAEFPKKTLDMLRQPLESRKVTISRIHSTATFPSRFILIAAMNPCPCGYLDTKAGYCSCTPKQIQAYQGKLSGPIRDRIDIFLRLEPINFEREGKKSSETSKIIQERVIHARQKQQERYRDWGAYSNGSIPFELFSQTNSLTTEQQNMLQYHCMQQNWSNRVQGKIFRIARTISDLRDEAHISDESLWEAIAYRISVQPRSKPNAKVSGR
ncbi:YifB family Mg chelatase-like AAA ATPase [Brevibacillus sp. H7]|uniref:YifB family Mg chelatase-like AAA ATPase n=1 Tax=Brevibacillus sp. H7 TaxID=3349138 RepID=UPI0037F3ED85